MIRRWLVATSKPSMRGSRPGLSALTVPSLALAALAGCHGHHDRSESTGAASLAPSVAVSAAPPSEPAPSASIVAAPPATSASASASWLGVPVDPSVRFSDTIRVAREDGRRFEAELRVPMGWHTVPLVNAMSGQTQARMAIAPDKAALIILMVYTAGVWHEIALGNDVGRWLSVSGGVSSIEPWGAPTPIELGDGRTPGTRLLGAGTLGREPAELWQVRRRFPSATTGKRALIAAGAIQRSAPPARRAELLAALATFSAPAEE